MVMINLIVSIFVTIVLIFLIVGLLTASGGNPFHNVEKTSVLQEARIFNETPVNARKCTHVLTKILYLLNQVIHSPNHHHLINRLQSCLHPKGEALGRTEATEAFFAMTKLFQSKDVVLRRMVYLGIKELSSIADDVIIVTSSLTKDMTGKEDTYRAPAIRALTAITDVGYSLLTNTLFLYLADECAVFVAEHDASSHRALHEAGHGGQIACRQQCRPSEQRPPVQNGAGSDQALGERGARSSEFRQVLLSISLN